MTRLTSNLFDGISRVIAYEAHGEHGGWSLTDGIVSCRCGDLRFELAVIA